MKFRRRSFFIMVSIILSIIMVFNCSKKLSTKNNLPLLSTLFNNSPSTNSEKGELKITFHDAPPVTDTIKMINITVIETQIIDFYDKKTVISDQVHSFDLLQLTANNPVVLSHTKVGAGTYKQIRLILDPNSTVTLKDGTVHPLKVPSGEQTGIKIDGIFTIPPEKLYTLDIDLDPTKSVHYAPGQGYMLKPVIKLTGENVFYGIFHYSGNFMNKEYLIEINSNATYKFKYKDYSNYDVIGHYIFDGLTNKAIFTNEKVICPSCENSINYPLSIIPGLAPKWDYYVKSFGLKEIIFIDQSNNQYNLFSANSYNFSELQDTINITFKIKTQNPTFSGKIMVSQIEPEDGNGRPYNLLAEIDSNENAYLNYSIYKESIDLSEKSYLLKLGIVQSFNDVQMGSLGFFRKVNNIICLNNGLIGITIEKNNMQTNYAEFTFQPENQK